MRPLDPAAHRDRYKGQDIYVIGSGPSLNHIPASFFNNKILVSANHGSMKVLDRVDYLVTKYHRHAWEYQEWWPHIPTVVPRCEVGDKFGLQLPANSPFIVVETNHNTYDKWTAADWPTEPNALIATWSTIATAMHWAAHLGAANIIMVGHDCGHIDETGRVPNYREEADGVLNDDGESWMWQQFDQQSRIVKAELMQRYSCTVTSLNPFINMNLEGHGWRSFAGSLNV